MVKSVEVLLLINKMVCFRVYTVVEDIDGVKDIPIDYDGCE